MIFQIFFFYLLNQNIQSQKQTRNYLVKILLKVNLSVVPSVFPANHAFKMTFTVLSAFLYRDAHLAVER